MPENEFEKKVSSEMQELRFKPSEQVWLCVEERIRKKKKRRVFIIIFLLGGLALLGYWQRSNLFGEQKNDIVKVVPATSSGENQKEENSTTSVEINSSSPTDQNTKTIKQKETNNTTDETVNDRSVDNRSVPDKENVIVSNIKKPKVSKNNRVAAKPGLIKTKTTQKPVIISDLVTVNSQKQKSIVDDNKTNEDIKANTQTEVEKEEVKQTEVNPLETKIDSVNREIVGTEGAVVKTKDTVAKDVLTSDSAKLVIEKKPSERKWKWGLHLTPGISSLNDQGFSIGSNKSLDVYNYQNPVGGSTGLPPARQQPSDARPGFALQAGVFAQRQLSPRTSFSLGLQYGYYNNVIHVGNRRDSLTGNSQLSNVMDDKANGVYNAGGDTIKYTNRYHFIEFPLIFQWQLNKNKAKPFTWSAGFTIGQLIATNAIMYDTAFNGIYYTNKSQLNKTQFSLSTGFSWTLANNKRAQWSLGPVANIHLNRLLDNPFENKKYLFFVGLRAGILFNSKK